MKLSEFVSILFSRENKELNKDTAYARSVLGKNLTMDELLEYYKAQVARDIEREIKYGYMECIISFPNWLVKDHKEKVIAFITKEYKVLYSNEHLVLVSWRQD